MTDHHRAHPRAAEVLRLVGDAAVLLDRAARSDAADGSHGSSPDGAPVSPELAVAVRAEAARIRSGAASLVVVGEKKRGKSSLINALIGHRGLLPVEVDVATGVHLVVRHADKPTAVAHLTDGSTPLTIDPADIAEYAAVDPITQTARRDDVHHVEVGVPAPLLASGLTLVDTPGVGGLVAGHARITMATLSQADALVFVVNGSSELTASELRFLEQATERIAEVVFVLTQTDKYREWPAVLERNRALLAEHAPRYAAAPWFPVSSRAKEDADAATAAGDRETAAHRLEASGFGPLTEALSGRIAEEAAGLRLANALHVTLSVLAPLAAVQERRLRSLAQDPTLHDEVRGHRDALRALQRSDATWRGNLRQAARELERRLRVGFQRNVNDLRQLAEEKIAASSGPDLATELPRDLEAGVEAIWLDLDNATRDGIARLVALMEHQCRLDAGPAVAELALARPERLDALPTLVSTGHDNSGALALVERVMPAWGAGGLAATVTALATGGVLLPLAAGFGMIALLSNRRKRRTDLGRVRGDAMRYAHRMVAELTTEIPPEITRTVDDVSERIAARITDQVSAQRALLEGELEELQRNLAADREQLAKERERARRRAAALGELITRGRDLAAAIGHPAAAAAAQAEGIVVPAPETA
ncbi:dynamin family protein [Streptomyces sp. NPDC048357]|uniref:dynamin family protein n=1 Tax=Streptomyces sp. NPDC048357 TaxID=3154719 RepID=UPI00342577B4